jgi:hypothetical protein
MKNTKIQRLAKKLRPETAVKAAPIVAPARAPDLVIPLEDVFRYEIKLQRGRTLRNAEDLLSRIQSFVEQLRAGEIPSAININAVAFVLSDHARLLTLEEALEVTTSK